MSGWVAGATVVTGLASAYMASNAAEDAAQQQADSAQNGINVQNAQFNRMQELLKPYVTAGNASMAQQQNMLGLNGNPAQQQSIDQIQNSPMFQSLNRQGQNAILQNASATGGLRGGNVEGALAKFSPALLNQQLQQQFGNLNQITAYGQAAASGQAAAGQANTNNVSNLYGLQGSALAGGDLAQGKAFNGFGNAIAGGLGAYGSQQRANNGGDQGGQGYFGGINQGTSGTGLGASSGGYDPFSGLFNNGEGTY